MAMKFRLFLGVSVAVVLLFATATGTQAQLSQCWNGNWTEPSCDPLTDLSCNVSPPLFSYATCLQGTSGEFRLFKYNNDGNELDDISQNPSNWTQLMPGYVGVGDVQSGWQPSNVSNYGYGDGVIQANFALYVGHFTSRPIFWDSGDISVEDDIYVTDILRTDGSLEVNGPAEINIGTVSGDGVFIQGLGFDSTDNVVRILNTAGGGGRGTILNLQQDGGDLGYFLRMDGWNNDIDVDYLGYFNSTGDFQIRIDRDNNTANFFRINNGANSTVLEVDEGGNLLASGDITTNSQFCIGTDCINSWDNTGYWSLGTYGLYANNTNWRVGIGTTTPLAALQVTGPDYEASPTGYGTQIARGLIELVRSQYPYIDFKNDTSNTNDYDARFLLRNDDLIHLQGASLSIGYSSTNLGASGLVVAGRLGVGTSTPDSTYQLVVDGDAYSTGSWNSSDIRLKRDIKTLTNLLDKVLQLRAVSFTWKDNTGFNLPEGKQIGLIAQEVEKYFPELVKTDSRGYKTIDYGKLVAVLIEAIKEQQTQIDDLSKRVERLESIINHLNK